MQFIRTLISGIFFDGYSKMRIRKIEFFVIALTFAFISFIGGYYVGSRGSVNITTVEPKYGEMQQFLTPGPSNTESVESITDADTTSPGNAAENAAPSAVPGNSPATETQAFEAAGEPRGGDGKIDINRASRSELMDLPGIGNVLAGRIVDYRDQYGSFSSIEEIKKVSGIGEKRFEAIKDRITV